MTRTCRLHEVFQKWSRWGWVDRSLIKLEEGPLITGYLGVELARVNTRGDIYPNARKLCVCSSSSISFQPLVHHHASSTMINVKNSAIKSEKKSAAGEGKGEGTLSPNIGCPFIKHHRFRSALISFPPGPSSSIPFLYHPTTHAQHFFIYCSFDLSLNALINDQSISRIRFTDDY